MFDFLSNISFRPVYKPIDVNQVSKELIRNQEDRRRSPLVTRPKIKSKSLIKSVYTLSKLRVLP